MSSRDLDPPPAAPGIDVVARHRGLVLRTAIVSLLTLASRVIGFAREWLSASIFGHASPVNDAFVTAWRVPNLFRALLGEGALTTSLQTALTREDAQRGAGAGRALFLAFARVVVLLSLAVCAAIVLVVWLVPERMPFTGWAWLGADPGPVRELLLRMMPFVVLVCLSAVAGGALQVRGHFASTALAPVVMNLGWIAALFLVIERHGLAQLADPAAEYARQMEIARALAWYVVGAGMLLVLVQLPALVRHGLLGPAAAGAPGADLPAEERRRRVVETLRSAAPLALGAAVYQVNLMVSGFLAEGLLANGGPSVLYYATRVQQLPLSLVSAAATSAVFPALAALGHERRRGELRALHDEAHLAIVFLAVPATLGLVVFAEPVISVCFEHGAFGPEGVARGAAGLRALALAIVPAGAVGLVARACYALGDTRAPVRTALAALVANLGLTLFFVLGLGLDVAGLALGTALASWLQLALLLPTLRRLAPADRADPARPALGARLRATCALALASVALGWAVWKFLALPRGSTLGLGAAIGVATLSYGLGAAWLELPEARALRARMRRGAR